MTKPTVLLLFLCLTTFLLAGNDPKSGKLNSVLPQAISFTENKGQVRDQYGHARPDVLFGGENGDMIFHLRKSGVSYELRKATKTALVDMPHHKKMERVQEWTYSRVDISWPGANQNVEVVRDKMEAGYLNFYSSGSENGILNVRSFAGVTYKKLYEGIDLHFYGTASGLKYDYILAPFADPGKIKLLFTGHRTLKISPSGVLLVSTGLGTIEEAAPLVYQEGKKIPARWKLEGDNLSFEIGAYDRSLPLLIDPAIRVWGSYYGGNLQDFTTKCSTDESGHVYFTGSANASGTIIATTGSHQSTSNSQYVAFLARFNAAGFREWCTFYGSAFEDGMDCASKLGHVYMVGRFAGTASVVTTSGAHQTVAGGGVDGFIVKFDTLGVRQWGTFYGGISNDECLSVAPDMSGNVYVAGLSSSPGNIASSNGFRATIAGTSATQDAFLVKFNSSGVRQWATYYGDDNTEADSFCMTDTLGNAYLGGWTFVGTIGGTIIATTGAHQTVMTNTLNGSYGYLVKFNSSGQRQWGTIYGYGNDHFYTGTTDKAGNIYVAGEAILNAGSGTIIATSGAHQTVNNGYADGMLVKFNTSGVRQWGTFFGSTSWDFIYGCSTDSAGSIFVGGTTSSSFASLFITPNTHQSTYGGWAEDAYLAKFSSLGQLQWSTYYGGEKDDQGLGVATGPGNVVYLSGTTSSTLGTTIATSNGHQPLPGGVNTDGFIVKFFDCIPPPAPTNTTTAGNRLICGNSGSTTLVVNATYPVNWYSTATSTAVLTSGLAFTTPTLPIGTYTFYAESLGCAPSGTRTAITVTVAPIPTIAAGSGSICVGNSYSIVATGAQTYTYSGGSSLVSPAVSTTYSVIGTSSAGCTTSAPAIVSVQVMPALTISVNSGQICPGKIFTIQAQGANSYQVSGGSFTVSPAQTATYLVTGYSANGCTATAISGVTLLAPPVLSVTSGSVCAGTAFTINASGAQTYTYLPAQIFTPQASTVFAVEGQAANGCTASVQGSVTVLTIPVISVSNGTVCAGNNFTIMPSGATTYSYSSGSSVVSPAVTSTYAVYGSMGACSNPTPVIITVSVYPVPVISVNSGSICAGNSFVIVPSGAATYSITGPSFTVSPGATTYYWVSGTSSAGCTSTASVKSNITVFPLPIVTAVSDKSVICNGQVINLLSQGALNYSWTNGPPTANYSLMPTATAVYTVTGLDANGCQATATVQVSVNTCTDILDVKNKNWSIYPNPAKEFIFIHSDIDQTIKLFDAAGRFVLSAQVKGTIKLDISQFASGIYFLEATGDTERTRVKLIKE